MSDDHKEWLLRLKSQDAEIQKLRSALDVAREALEGFQLGHLHDETEPDYRPLGDSYGWCSKCSTKVGLYEDYARDALAAIDAVLQVSSGEKV